MAKKKTGRNLAALAAFGAALMPTVVNMREGQYPPNYLSDEERVAARKKALPGRVFTESGLPLETEGADGFGASYVKSGMKKGGSVKGWGMARGARKAKVY
jgi:hypothetical protein